MNARRRTTLNEVIQDLRHTFVNQRLATRNIQPLQRVRRLQDIIEDLAIINVPRTIAAKSRRKQLWAIQPIRRWGRQTKEKDGTDRDTALTVARLLNKLAAQDFDNQFAANINPRQINGDGFVRVVQNTASCRTTI